MARNGKKWREMVRNGEKWREMARNGKKWRENSSVNISTFLFLFSKTRKI
jgi:hypothetical protein